MKIQSICEEFIWTENQQGGQLITPWRYDDGDQVVVFATRNGDEWRLDDNGEGLFRLSLSGVDTGSTRVRTRLQAIESLFGVHMDDESDSLYIVASEDSMETSALVVAEASAQVMALSCLRHEHITSDFKDHVISILREVEKESGIEARYDAPMEQDGLLIADALFLSAVPLAVIVANSTTRLLEAEMMWLNGQRMGDPTQIYAVVENAAKVGRKEVARANYFTSKTLEFEGFKQQFRQTITSAVKRH